MMTGSEHTHAMADGSAPGAIYLQWWGDEEPDRTEATPFVSDYDVSWCRDKVFEWDIRYVRDKRSRTATGAVEALLDEALAKSAAVIRLTALSGREDGYHYTVPYGVAECQALTALSAFLDRDEVKKRLVAQGGGTR